MDKTKEANQLYMSSCELLAQTAGKIYKWEKRMKDMVKEEIINAKQTLVEDDSEV